MAQHPGSAPRSAGTEAWAELWARTAERADERMGGGRISLVGAVESAAAGVDALDPQAPAKRLWKRRSLRELGNPFGIPTFPQPQQQQAFYGYISNGSTGSARVTFLDGLTGVGVLTSAVSELWRGGPSGSNFRCL